MGGFIAFLMECAEFLLVSYTSGLTLSVAGDFFKAMLYIVIDYPFGQAL